MKKLITILLVFLNVGIFAQINDSIVNAYYDTIVHYTEFSNNRWEKQTYDDNIKLYVTGDKEDYLMEELSIIINDLNELIYPLTITITYDSLEHNMLLFMGERKDFRKICSEVDRIDYKIRGYGVTYKYCSRVSRPRPLIGNGNCIEHGCTRYGLWVAGIVYWISVSYY